MNGFYSKSYSTDRPAYEHYTEIKMFIRDAAHSSHQKVKTLGTSWRRWMLSMADTNSGFSVSALLATRAKDITSRSTLRNETTGTCIKNWSECSVPENSSR